MNEGSKWIDVPLSHLVKWKENYKEDDDHKLNALVENMRRNGQAETIIVREIGDAGEGMIYEVINGNHRVDAFHLLGWNEPVHCRNYGEIPDALAARIAVETNETRFPTNWVLLDGIVENLKLQFPAEDLKLTLPFGLKDMQRYQLTDIQSTQADGGGELGTGGFENFDHKCPRCSFEWND